MQVAKPTKMNEMAKRLSNCVGASRFARSAKSAIAMVAEKILSPGDSKGTRPGRIRPIIAERKRERDNI